MFNFKAIVVVCTGTTAKKQQKNPKQNTQKTLLHCRNTNGPDCMDVGL